MKNPATWNRTDLHTHLQHALDVEFWTIPLYLTALYSIKGLRNLRPSDYPPAAKLIQSVVIQEMLHMEIVCNLSNALGCTPHFRAPVYADESRIPFIHPHADAVPEHLRGYISRPGALEAKTLKLFCVIEMPHAAGDMEWEKQKSYHSIAEMYSALRLGILHLWESCYVGDVLNTKQKISFHDYEGKHRGQHGFSQVMRTPEDAERAIEAIVEQGEGADQQKVPADFRPPKLQKGKEFDSGWYKGELSHYQKFSMLLHHLHALPEVYPIKENADVAKEQVQLQTIYAALLDTLQQSFSIDGPDMHPAFWDTMYALTNALMDVWEAGACPDFV